MGTTELPGAQGARLLRPQALLPGRHSVSLSAAWGSADQRDAPAGGPARCQSRGSCYARKVDRQLWALEELGVGHFSSPDKTSAPSLLETARGPGSSPLPQGRNCKHVTKIANAHGTRFPGCSEGPSTKLLGKERERKDSDSWTRVWVGSLTLPICRVAVSATEVLSGLDER